VDSNRIEMAALSFGADIEEGVLRVLRSGMIAQGPEVERLEDSVAAVVGASHAIAVANGTLSLISALIAAGVGRGDEVITTPFTFGATAQAILAVGASVVFSDIEPVDFNIDPSLIESLIGPRTAAVMPVHLYGRSADMTRITSICAAHRLAMIEDAAQALGATHEGRSVGSFGVGSFSLYATKNVAAGEGGIVTTSDPAVAQAVRRFRNQGMHQPYHYAEFGINGRMTDLLAAVAVPQVAALETITNRRISNAVRLSEALADACGIVVPRHDDRSRHAFHQYTIRVTQQAGVSREQLRARMVAKGVSTGVYYPSSLLEQSYFAEHPRVKPTMCPIAQAASLEVLSLPVHQHLTDNEVDRVAQTLLDELR
jgi:perosamine synthetase